MKGMIFVGRCCDSCCNALKLKVLPFMSWVGSPVRDIYSKILSMLMESPIPLSISVLRKKSSRNRVIQWHLSSHQTHTYDAVA